MSKPLQHPIGVLYLQVKHPFTKSIVADHPKAQLAFERLFGPEPIMTSVTFDPSNYWWICPTENRNLYPLWEQKPELTYDEAFAFIETEAFGAHVAELWRALITEEVDSELFDIDDVQLVVLGDLFYGKTAYAERVLTHMFPDAQLVWPEEAPRQQPATSPTSPVPVSPEDDVVVLELETRIYTQLRRFGIRTIGDLIAKSEGEIKAIPMMGNKSIDKIVEKLKDHGQKLRED